VNVKVLTTRLPAVFLSRFYGVPDHLFAIFFLCFIAVIQAMHSICNRLKPFVHQCFSRCYVLYHTVQQVKKALLNSAYLQSPQLAEFTKRRKMLIKLFKKFFAFGKTIFNIV
jgi:hypothetical protein